MSPNKLDSFTGQLAGYDGPTGLPSKAIFFDRLKQALIKAERDSKTAAVFFISIDRFKVINDTFGKDVGDIVLSEISGSFLSVLRQSDTLGRPGRDEFMIILPEIAKAEDASIVARKLLDSLRTPFKVGGKDLFINVNIGISLFPEDATDAEELLSRAYTAKIWSAERGKNKYRYYSPAINERAFKLLELETELRMALERKEFVLHYQPVLCLKDLSITAMEALIRWDHPNLGLLSPAHFIDVAEQSEMISHIGMWVMDSAFSQNKLWSESGLDGSRMAVNLSARQFSSRNLIDDISRMLDNHTMDPGLLEIEVTESSLIHSITDTEAKFRSLKDMGVSLALDDFGTGYSSLSYIKNLPFDRVKIDRSFVKNICNEPRDAAIASAIIEMAHALDMKVTGEGVENEAQLDLLRFIGCDEIQGFLFSSPVSSDSMGQLLSAPSEHSWADYS